MFRRIGNIAALALLKTGYPTRPFTPWPSFLGILTMWLRTLRFLVAIPPLFLQYRYTITLHRAAVCGEMMKQHLAHAYDIPYLVTWNECLDSSTSLDAVVRRADSDFIGTFADEPKTLRFPKYLVDEIGFIETIEQTLATLAPVRLGLNNP